MTLASPPVRAPGRLRLDSLSGICRHLQRQHADLRGLGRQCIDLLAPIGRLQFDYVVEVLGSRQARREVEVGIYVAPGDINDFAVERDGTLPRSVEGPLKRRHRRVESLHRAVTDARV